MFFVCLFFWGVGGGGGGFNATNNEYYLPFYHPKAFSRPTVVHGTLSSIDCEIFSKVSKNVFGLCAGVSGVQYKMKLNKEKNTNNYIQL